MVMKLIAVILLITCTCSVNLCVSSKIFAGLFPNWAQYRESPYTFTPKHLQGIVGRLDHLIYGHAYFNSEDFRVAFTDPRDKIFIQNLMSYKTSHPQLKVLISIGGESFPSKNFSEMASSSISRALFVSSLRIFLDDNRFDGININWKWPCSPQRTIYKREHRSKANNMCYAYTEFLDGGSRCPQDGNYFLSLLKEMRESLSNATIITATCPPFEDQINCLPFTLYSKYLDYLYVESYGYTVSAASRSYMTAPLAPLNHPPRSAGVNHESINSTGKLEKKS